MGKIKSGVHKIWMSIFGTTKDSTVGTVNWREVGASVIVAIVFYAMSGNLEDVLHTIDPNGQAVNQIVSMLTLFVVSLFHKSATGTKTKTGEVYVPADHVK